jgi:EAL domain-containing protein (putative c-di-GMP-specific phosphodiesterase class I)
MSFAIPSVRFSHKGVVVALGRWVFEQACRQLRQWEDQHIAPPTLSLNVSGVQLKRASAFERDFAECLGKWNVDPGVIEIELTEAALTEVSQKGADSLERLRLLTVRVAIDDFGSGRASLRELTSRPVDRLKIAQALVFAIGSDARDAMAVRAAVRLAQELGVDFMAKGVETEAQASFLQAAGCKYAQGNYWHRPLSAEVATELLRRAASEPVAGLPHTAKPTAA